VRAYVRALGAALRASVGAQGILGINRRNLCYVQAENRFRDLPLADDKLQTKEAVTRAGVPIPETYFVYRRFFELQTVARDLSPHGEFVIKPSHGRLGSGILVITGREAESWRDIAGGVHRADDLRRHILDIVFGTYTNDLPCAALVEERVQQHPQMMRMSPLGLADIRLLLYREEPVTAMLRIPTSRSRGKANLHQGGVGVGVDVGTGRTTRALWKARPVEAHPDTGFPLLGFQVPDWATVLGAGVAAARSVPLKYIGADIASSERGPVLLEINARPGIEIQNVNRAPLRSLLERIARRP
jgi:alpha-L-glutamate ligase-like protein